VDNLFDLPGKGDPLHLVQFFTEARNLLDECFRQIIAGPSSILVHLAIGSFAIRMNASYGPSSLTELGNICNTPDRQHLRRFVDEHSYFHRMQHRKANGKYVLNYYVPVWMGGFFLDPIRSRDLYSTSLVIDKCQKAINSLFLAPNDPRFNSNSLECFFMPTRTEPGDIPIDNIANATRLLESARNGSDQNELLLFLEYLSKIHWLDIYNGNEDQRHFTNGIVYWVCTTLVG
jgi:hypothetical protein